MSYQAVRIMHNLESRAVIFNHLRPWEIGKNILPIVPMGPLHDIFPCGQTLSRIGMLLSKLIQAVQINDNHTTAVSFGSYL
jgi:hypothetical protein